MIVFNKNSEQAVYQTKIKNSFEKEFLRRNF